MISAPDNLPELAKMTSDTGYLRFHGRTEWYKYHYSDEEIMRWRQKLKELSAERIYIYFNNDYGANAIKNAQRLKQAFNGK